MSDTVTRVVTDSAKAASILTDANGRLWDFSNPVFIWIEQDNLADHTNTPIAAHVAIPLATVQAAWLATRS